MPSLDSWKASSAVVAAVLLLTYSPVAFHSFGFHNDYWAWGFDASWCCGEHPEGPITSAIGRIIATKLLTAQFLFIDSLDDLLAWRVITAVTLTLNAVYFLYLLRREVPAVHPGIVVAATILVFLHKTMQLNVLWASNFAYFNPPILLALVSAHLLSLARERADRPAVAASLCLLSLPPFIAALFTYQPTATFLIVPLLWGLLMRPPKLQDSILVGAGLAAVLVAGFGLYVLIHRHLVLPSLPSDVTMSTYRWELPPQPFRTALSRLLKFYLPSAAQGWTVWASLALGFILQAVILLGLAVSAMRHWRQGARAAALAETLAVGAVFGLAALSILPNLVAEQFATSIRVMFVPGAALGLGFLWALTRLLPPAAAPLAFAGLTGAAGLLAFGGVATTAAVAAAEHEAIGAALAPLARSERQDILILRSNAARQFLGFETDEAFRPLPPIVFIGDHFLGRRHRGEANFDLSIISTRQGQPPIFVAAGTTVIDIQPLLEAHTRVRPVRFGVLAGQVAVTPPGAGKGIADAFDGSAETFWEAWTTPFPIVVQVDFSAPRPINGYSMVSGTHQRSDRMPTGWEVAATTDGREWTVIDRQMSTLWRDGQVRRFPIAPGGPWTSLRFAFIENGLPAGGTEGLRLYEMRFD